jgi:hypothetical protein
VLCLFVNHRYTCDNFSRHSSRSTAVPSLFLNNNPAGRSSNRNPLSYNWQMSPKPSMAIIARSWTIDPFFRDGLKLAYIYCNAANMRLGSSLLPIVFEIESWNLLDDSCIGVNENKTGVTSSVHSVPSSAIGHATHAHAIRRHRASIEWFSTCSNNTLYLTRAAAEPAWARRNALAGKSSAMFPRVPRCNTPRSNSARCHRPSHQVSKKMSRSRCHGEVLVYPRNRVLLVCYPCQSSGAGMQHRTLESCT